MVNLQQLVLQKSRFEYMDQENLRTDGLKKSGKDSKGGRMDDWTNRMDEERWMDRQKFKWPIGQTGK